MNFSLSLGPTSIHLLDNCKNTYRVFFFFFKPAVTSQRACFGDWPSLSPSSGAKTLTPKLFLEVLEKLQAPSINLCDSLHFENISLRTITLHLTWSQVLRLHNRSDLCIHRSPICQLKAKQRAVAAMKALPLLLQRVSLTKQLEEQQADMCNR